MKIFCKNHRLEKISKLNGGQIRIMSLMTDEGRVRIRQKWTILQLL
jgi:hypothetical protein